jgi:hypothetical protein
MARPHNRHRPTSAPRQPDAVFAAWPEWKQNVFEAAFGAFARRVHARIGYSQRFSPPHDDS